MRFIIPRVERAQAAHMQVSLILVRIRRLSLGNAGDVRPVVSGISEMRIDYGPGYRVYFVKRGEELLLLLAGGDKSSQRRDIEKARELGESL